MTPINLKRLLIALIVAAPIIVTIGYFVDLTWFVVVGILLLGHFAGFKSPERDLEAEKQAQDDDDDYWAQKNQSNKYYDSRH